MNATKLALLGGEPIGEVHSDPHPDFSPEAIARVTELLQRGQTVGLNKENRPLGEAEAAIAAWQGVAHCLATSSGHAALHSALIGLEIASGDEVITTPYTWGASISCILHNNAIPIFADVDPETGLLDPATVEALITPRTRAILAVHIYGQAANMTALCSIARKHGLVVIEDGSQAHGAIHQGRKVGQFGDAAGFSCMGGKLLATSEGGYMVTPHAEVYWKAALCGQHMGRSGEKDFPENLLPYVDSLLYTYRMSPITAILLAEQLKKLDAENAGRRRNVALFREALAGIASVRFPQYAAGDDPSYHMLTMNFQPEAAGISKETYLQALQAEKVGIFQYIPSPISTWRRLHWQDYDGPKVMWTENLRRYGVDYRQVQVPKCEFKIARSLEMGWNYIRDDETRINKLAAAFHKVEEQLPALREWEVHEHKANI
jgi:dTDP-4-amino-4,6-dideoxygalactose transaminase